MAKIGFIGLGRMGKPMANNMQTKGFSLHVHDIIDAPVQHLVDLGASAATSVAEVARQCQTIIRCCPATWKWRPSSWVRTVSSTTREKAP